MADAKRKPLALMIAAMGKKPGGDDAPEPDGDEAERPEHSDGDLLTACEDVIDAVKGGDAAALNKALIAWQDLYGSRGAGEAD